MALPFDTYRFQLCKESGEPINEATGAKARGLKFQRNGAHSASLVLDLDDALSARIVPGLTRLKVFCSSVTTRPVFYGLLPPINSRKHAAAGTHEMTFVDPRVVFPRRFNDGTERFVQIDQGAILSQLLTNQNARAGGDTFIRPGAVTTGTLRDRTYDQITDLASLFTNMSQVIGGPDFDVVPFDGFADHGLTYGSIRVMGLLNVYGHQGATLPTVRFMYGPGYPSNVLDMDEAFLDLTTQATVTGTGTSAIGATDSVPLTSTYSEAASSIYGLWEDRESAQDVIVQATLDTQARGIVDDQKILRRVVTISSPTREAKQPIRDYFLGDTVYATCRKGSMVFVDHPLRVDALGISIDQQGALDVTITGVTTT